jgi:hypothetical protein
MGRCFGGLSACWAEDLAGAGADSWKAATGSGLATFLDADLESSSSSALVRRSPAIVSSSSASDDPLVVAMSSSSLLETAEDAIELSSVLGKWAILGNLEEIHF